MSKFLYPIYKLKTKSYIKWWLYHKKAGGSGVLSEILEGFSFNLENTLNRKFKLFEIEGNSVQDGSPSPDNEVPILSSGDNGSINEKIQTRNLFNKNTITEGKYIDNNGNFVNDSSNFVSDFIKLLSIDTNLAYRISATTARAKRIVYYDNSKTFISRQLVYTTQGKLNIPENASYVRLSCYNDDLESLQLEIIEEGSTATPYVEHEEQDYSIFVQQPMRSIGDVRDKFNENNKTEDHYIARKIFDGTEDWTRGQVGDIYRFSTTLSDILAINARNIVLSNYFKYNGDVSVNIHGIIFASNKNIFIYPDENITTVSELKAWIAEKYANGHPLYVDYKSEESQVLPCTEEQIQQLENKPSTYKDFTIIQSEDETPAYLKIQYYKEG